MSPQNPEHRVTDDEWGRYRSMFESIERRVFPEVVFGWAPIFFAVPILLAVVGILLPHTGSAHGLDVLVGTENAHAESVGVLSMLFVGSSILFTVVVAVIARAAARLKWAALALVGNGATTVFAVLAIWSRQSLIPRDSFAGPAIGLYVGALAAVLSTALWAGAVFTRAPEQPEGPKR
ncbi:MULTISPECIES: Rv2732c family membrane protein [Rhodococcus]|uniref:Rv2732c family membrane protein n=1 Tax=Rhodococcus TaxID=1827 RepID=UPI0006BA6A07|nr:MULTISPECIES: hypothetical protein [Rhodococcus]KPH21575.1 hypothetical protein AN948_00960 [Rhodococcus sp. ADH]QXC46829.1 hypothetical protein KSE96_33475 [Rhodococcus qingshengii]